MKVVLNISIEKKDKEQLVKQAQKLDVTLSEFVRRKLKQ